MVHYLWKQKKYITPNFWSIKELLTRCNKNSISTRIYVSPMSYSVDRLEKPICCERCVSFFSESFNDYNISQNISAFEGYDCKCFFDWEEKFADLSNDLSNIQTRVNKELKEIV